MIGMDGKPQAGTDSASEGPQVAAVASTSSQQPLISRAPAPIWVPTHAAPLPLPAGAAHHQGSVHVCRCRQQVGHGLHLCGAAPQLAALAASHGGSGRPACVLTADRRWAHAIRRPCCATGAGCAVAAAGGHRCGRWAAGARPAAVHWRGVRAGWVLLQCIRAAPLLHCCATTLPGWIPFCCLLSNLSHITSIALTDACCDTLNL